MPAENVERFEAESRFNESPIQTRRNRYYPRQTLMTTGMTIALLVDILPLLHAPRIHDFSQIGGITPMTRMKASDFPQELLNLFDGYVHGGISRREFMDGAQKYAVGGMTAAALFEALKPNYALAIEVQPDDKRIKGEEVTVPSPQGNGSIKGYLVRPANAQKLPVVLVVHENRGLNPYIRDVARRLAVNGFMALAPDGLTSVGGYPGDDEKGATLFGQVNGAKMREDFFAAATWLIPPRPMARASTAAQTRRARSFKSGLRMANFAAMACVTGFCIESSLPRWLGNWPNYFGELPKEC